MEAARQIVGGVFSRELEGGRAGCRLEITAAALRATTNDGHAFELPLASMQVELGGSSGHMLFCRPPEREPTLFSEDPSLIAGLRLVAPQSLERELDSLTRRASRQRKRVLTAAALATLLLVGLITAVPMIMHALAPRVVTEIPASVDQTLGKVAIESMDLGGSAVNDPRLVTVVEKIVARLQPQAAALVPKPTFAYHTHVVHSPQLNAFALPGGEIVVYTGLLAVADDPQQVAGVLAHEISHVIRRHGLQRIAQSLGVIGGVQLVLGDAGGLLKLGTELLTLAMINDYSRDQERQADADAVRLMTAAELDPHALAAMFATMKKQLADTPADGVVSWLGSHPALDERMQTIRAAAPPKEIEPLAVDWAAAQQALTELPALPAPTPAGDAKEKKR